MRNVSNTGGCFGYGETSGEVGDFTTTSSRKNDYEAIINKANTVPLIRVLNHYGLYTHSNYGKIICPFKSHSNGRENTASFQYYPHSNTFWCHGCKKGNQSTNFVANMEDIPILKAAHKIINLFSGDVSDDVVIERQDFSERLEIMLDFSNTVREFRTSNLSDHAIAFIEEICSVYDTLNLRHKLDNDALRTLTVNLKEEIISYNHV
jgi:hypothetical protein